MAIDEQPTLDEQLAHIEERLDVIQQRMDDLAELDALLNKVKPRISRAALAAVEALPGEWLKRRSDLLGRNILGRCARELREALAGAEEEKDAT